MEPKRFNSHLENILYALTQCITAANRREDGPFIFAADRLHEFVRDFHEDVDDDVASRTTGD
jgi:hypothetical protein